MKEEGIGGTDNFDRSEFGRFISLPGIIDTSNNAQIFLENLENKIREKLLKFSISEEEKIIIEAALVELNIETSTVFWLIRGKNILESVTNNLVKSIVNQKVSNQKSDIVSSTFNSTEILVLLEAYKQTREKWEEILLEDFLLEENPFFDSFS